MEFGFFRRLKRVEFLTPADCSTALTDPETTAAKARATAGDEAEHADYPRLKPVAGGA